MEMIQSNQTGTEIQLNLFEAIKDLLLVKPIFLIGVFLIGFFLFWIFNKDKTENNCFVVGNVLLFMFDVSKYCRYPYS